MLVGALLNFARLMAPARSLGMIMTGNAPGSRFDARAFFGQFFSPSGASSPLSSASFGSDSSAIANQVRMANSSPQQARQPSPAPTR